MRFAPMPLVSEAIKLVDNEVHITATRTSALVGEKEAPLRFIDSVGESWKDRAEKNIITSNIPILANVEKVGGMLIDSAGQGLRNQAENNVITSNLPLLTNIDNMERDPQSSKQKEGWPSLGEYIPGVGHIAGIVNLVTGNTDGHRCRLGAKCVIVAKCMIGAASTAVMSCATIALKAYATAYATAAVKAGASSALNASTTIATGGVGLVGDAVAKGASAALGSVTTGIKTATLSKLPFIM
ncbi:unnamed protein product [Fusarium equiseti]|uniref:Uncharacterized protein n=1 Tax=Fusarium equiseti TaxID=61235 RepID=A0A8J2IWN3_FUSEQ|nr:unnamed protein product [Fusarium equiseti]